MARFEGFEVETVEDSLPVQYIIVRTDLESMTPGRVAAQTAHAANHCVGYVKNNHRDSNILNLWERETTGELFSQWFGTTIVLGGSIREINEVLTAVSNSKDPDLWYGRTHDPEYHLIDGEVVHLIPLDTCGWVFGPRNKVKEFVKHLELYSG